MRRPTPTPKRARPKGWRDERAKVRIGRIPCGREGGARADECGS
jgi:hypothetical protein